MDSLTLRWMILFPPVGVFNTLRSLLKSEDNWKIKFRELYENTYTSLWKSLLRIGKMNEALFAADQGRAQTLYDNLLLQYGTRLALIMCHI